MRAARGVRLAGVVLAAACVAGSCTPSEIESGAGASACAPRDLPAGTSLLSMPGEGFLAGARPSIVGLPGHETVSDSSGAFSFEDVPAVPVTLLLEHPDYAPTQTGELPVGPDGLDRVTFQTPPRPIFGLLAALLAMTPDPERCQIASTVTRAGSSLYGPGPTHGEPGATVSIEPSLPAESGPVYFRLYSRELIFSDRTLTETSEDGGVVFVNVPPGEYRLQASKPGRVFSDVRISCRPGLLVNASPPFGLSVIAEPAASAGP